MFENIKNLEELKTEYRRLAMIYHPDQGGSEEEMKRVNSEYDRLFPVFQRREIMNGTRKESNETAQSTRREFYTQNGWAGDNYDRRFLILSAHTSKPCTRPINSASPPTMRACARN